MEIQKPEKNSSLFILHTLSYPIIKIKYFNNYGWRIFNDVIHRTPNDDVIEY